MKKYCVLSILVIVISILLVGCNSQNGNNKIVVTTSLDGKPVLVGDIPCSFPLVSDDTSLNIMAVGHGDIKQDDVYVWKKYSQMTGVDVNWTTVAREQRDESVNVALTNKQNLDLIMRCKIPANLLSQYGSKGLILDLAKNDLLKKNAPNCWAYLQSHKEALASVMNPDGTIYALPQINSGAELRVSRKIFINKKWLKRVKMDVPTTTEELYKVLKAFKEKDANGNGDTNDEIPLCSQDMISIQDVLYGAFGLANRGTHNNFVDCDESTGKVRLIAASDGYKEYVKYLRRLYKEGLMDNGMFTMTREQWYNYADSDRLGAFANTNFAGLPADKTDDWVAVTEALEGPSGDKLCTAIRANFHSTGAAVIPSTCSNPGLVLKWLDYFWTDEGTLFYHMGIEGETFVANDDGSYDYDKSIYKEMEKDNKPFDDVIGTYSPYPGGGNPTVEVAPYFMGGEMAKVPADAARKLFKYGPKEYWPSFTFTAKENDTLDRYQPDIQKYCETMLKDFVIGKKSLSEWNSYLSQLDKLGEQKVLKVYQAAEDRYEKNYK